MGSRLKSITIPASTEEIDGSAFVGCPHIEIEVAPGNRNFRIEGEVLVTSDGRKIVRYFGRELEVIVPKEVEILGNSCFEACDELERILFEDGSQLRTIGRSAISNCKSFKTISIPETVTEIEEAAFNNCLELNLA
jgi:hypothetical protein